MYIKLFIILGGLITGIGQIIKSNKPETISDDSIDYNLKLGYRGEYKEEVIDTLLRRRRYVGWTIVGFSIIILIMTLINAFG